MCRRHAEAGSSVLVAPAARRSTLAAGVPGGPLLAIGEPPAFFVVTPVHVFLEPAAAFGGHRAFRHGESGCAHRKDAHALERTDGLAAIRPGHDRDGGIFP